MADGLEPEEIAPPGHESLFKDAKKEAPPTLEELHDAEGMGHLDAEDEGEVSSEAEEAWKSLEKGQQQALIRLHNNSGHRPNRVIARALFIAGAPRNIMAAARALRYPVCHELDHSD